MTFPFDWSEQGLQEVDFDLFISEFAETVRLFLPCLDVHFAGPSSGGDLPSLWKAGVEMVRSEQKPVVDAGKEEHLYLPLWAADALVGVAVIHSAAGTYENCSSVWLLEKSRVISVEMKRIKQYAVDAVTGLPSGMVLNSRLQRFLDFGQSNGNEFFSLALLEIYPRARDGEQALGAIGRSAAFLDSLIGHLFTPCHLGNGIFGLLWEGVDEEQALKMADMLLRWLKREGVFKSQIGIRSFCRTEEDITCAGLFDQAWEALGIARKRGPFALCSYLAVSNPEAHPLCPPPGSVLRRLAKLWKSADNFALVLLHSDHSENDGGVSWSDLVEDHLVVIDDQEAFVFLAHADRSQVEEWCRSFLSRVAGEKSSFSIGAAFFPEHSFKKSEIPANCRKALLHTGFFGPGSMTFFDAVSLNISGDIFYNEGDLARAVQEYRLGLQLDGKNINLLNSLGVTFAQMNQYKKAIPLFEEALVLDANNFMALFNLGFAWLASGEEAKALGNFEKALKAQAENFDLLLQLGKLYCKAGRYQDAVDVLGRGEQVGPVGVRDISHGAVYRYLGEAHRGLGENGKAMSCLQRAVRHNPRDAESLSLLGELYCREGQGSEVALSLCRQAVELEALNWRHWFRFAFVNLELGDYDAAREAVRQGLALDSKNNDFLFLLGAIYQARGKNRLAGNMFKKLKKNDSFHAEAMRRLAELKD
ncbi:MAG: tetratricopeptide repeat protein [Desulfobulbaceae bacterium]|nr:tetratricopeptide repeat protein [Desulfobulbaceae bacterium]